MKAQHFDLHAEITNRIVEAIETGPGDFILPWHRASATHVPKNATTGKAYRGVNILSLWITAEARGYQNAGWATFKQWSEAGAHVRKGEKGTPIVFYKMLDKVDESDDAGQSEERRIPFARASWVFNVDQVDGYVAPDAEPREPTVFAPITRAQDLIAATGARIDFGGSRAFYRPSEDRIQIPLAGDFIGSPTATAQETFYMTILHELAHWTGAEHRLNRIKGKRFADRDYCFEELIAEMSAAFSCARLGIATTPRADHAHYIDQYLRLMKADKRAIFAAATAAGAATDFIMAFEAGDASSHAA